MREVETIRCADEEFSKEIYLLRKSIKEFPDKVTIRFSIIMAGMFAFVELVHRVF